MNAVKKCKIHSMTTCKHLYANNNEKKERVKACSINSAQQFHYTTMRSEIKDIYTLTDHELQFAYFNPSIYLKTPLFSLYKITMHNYTPVCLESVCSHIFSSLS